MYVSIHPKRPGKFYTAYIDAYRECGEFGAFFENKSWRSYGIRMQSKDFVKHYDRDTGKHL